MGENEVNENYKKELIKKISEIDDTWILSQILKAVINMPIREEQKFVLSAVRLILRILFRRRSAK